MVQHNAAVCRCLFWMLKSCCAVGTFGTCALQIRGHQEAEAALRRQLSEAVTAQAAEYERGRHDGNEASAPLREKAAMLERVQADLAKTRAALQEQLIRASSFNESEMLDRRIVKKLLVRPVASSHPVS
jgi:hypothetical protein